MAENGDELRVIFTGHSGLEKNTLLTCLCEYIYNNDPTWMELNGIDRLNYERSLAQHYSLEKPRQSSLALNMKTFLQRDEDDRQNRWMDAISHSISQWKSERPRYAFFSLHVTHHFRSEISSPLAWRSRKQTTAQQHPIILSLLKTLKPHYVVTLIDDIAYVQDKIHKEGFTISLRELLIWRNIEILMSDLLAT